MRVVTAFINSSRQKREAKENASGTPSKVTASESEESGGLTLSSEARESLQQRRGFLKRRHAGQFSPLRSAFLYETGHFFLNLRVQMALDLLAAGAELSPFQQYFVDGMKKVVAWFGTDSDSFLKVSVNEVRPMHEKFVRTYEAYIMGEDFSLNK